MAERTRELDRQKHFVEVVLETLPLGVFVIDAELPSCAPTGEGARTLGGDPSYAAAFAQLLSPTCASRSRPPAGRIPDAACRLDRGGDGRRGRRSRTFA